MELRYVAKSEEHQKIIDYWYKFVSDIRKALLAVGFAYPEIAENSEFQYALRKLCEAKIMYEVPQLVLDKDEADGLKEDFFRFTYKFRPLEVKV